MKRFLIIITFLLVLRANGQQDSLNRELVKNNRYFSFIYENDFFSATDRYYSQGVMLELVMPFMRKSPFSKTLIRWNKNAQNYYGLRVEQDCFTPVSIRFDTLNRLERPYSGTFAMGHFLSSIDPVKKQRLYTQLDLGVIGPLAKCEETQKGIHKALDNIAPLGWENQISNDLLLNYKFQYEKALVSAKYIELIGTTEARAGTIYDDIGAGIHLRTGKINSYFDNYGITKNAAKNKFQAYFTAKAKGKLVAYNGTLQGGLFTKSIYEIAPQNVTRAVFFSYLSVVVTYKRLSLEYARTYLSKEFKTGLDHGWGRCNITVCF